MKNRKKLLLLLLLLNFLLLITTTYAWFSSNRVVSIDTFNVHVQADGGLEVSTDATNWKQVITVKDIMDATNNYPSNVNQIPYRMYPTSTGGNLTGGFLDMFSGEATNTSGVDFVLVSSKSEEERGFGEDSEGKFIAFDLFFKTANTKTLYLSSNSEVVYTGDKATGIENATRVAFINEGVTDTPLIAQNLKNGNKAIIWEPNYDVHTEGGVAQAKNIYGINTSLTGGALLPYDGVINPVTTAQNVLVQNANSATYPNLFKRVNVDISTVYNSTQNKEILELEPDITKVRIYMWIEGQDVDCEDNASYGDISFKLEFTTNPA